MGVVLLSSTMPLWMEFDWARMSVAAVGISTAVFSALVGNILPDRKVLFRCSVEASFFNSFSLKGAIANATSGTIGLIYVVLALGHADAALLLSFGHAAFRICQILRSPNVITDSQNMRAGMSGNMPFPKVSQRCVFLSCLTICVPKIVPAWLYRLGWAMRRIHSDFHLIHVLHLVSRRVHTQQPWKLSRWQQWAITVAFLLLAGAPFTPIAHWKDEAIIYLLEVNPMLALGVILVATGVSVVAVRVLLVKVLTRKRFATKKLLKK